MLIMRIWRYISHEKTPLLMILFILLTCVLGKVLTL